MSPRANSRYISTMQAADALGVSVSTVKRWVDEEILPAHRTPGGHRKLLRAEVLALVRQGDLPSHDLAGLSTAACQSHPLDCSELAAALFAALLKGEAKEVSALVRAAYHAATPLETLADRVIAPVLGQIGHDWEAARIDIWQEHRATQVCAAALFELKDELAARAERNRPVALGAVPQGDPYQLATLLAQMVLLDAGWEAVNLGPHTPLESLARAVRALQPRLVWLSVSFLENADAFLREYREFYRVAEEAGVAVAVGGQALTEPIRAAMPYTTFGDGLSHLAAFARTLHPRPQRPPRGRPPQS